MVNLRVVTALGCSERVILVAEDEQHPPTHKYLHTRLTTSVVNPKNLCGKSKVRDSPCVLFAVVPWSAWFENREGWIGVGFETTFQGCGF